MRMGEGRLAHGIWCWTPPGLSKSERPIMTIGRIRIREGGEVGGVFDGRALIDGLGQVVVVNHCFCLMRLQAWEDLSK